MKKTNAAEEVRRYWPESDALRMGIGWDEYDILSVIKEKPYRKPRLVKRRNFFAVKANDLGCLNYLNAQAVRELIIRGEKLIFDYLQERANG